MPAMTPQANSKAGHVVRTVGKNRHRVAFLACARYNYCNLVRGPWQKCSG